MTDITGYILAQAPHPTAEAQDWHPPIAVLVYPIDDEVLAAQAQLDPTKIDPLTIIDPIVRHADAIGIGHLDALTPSECAVLSLIAQGSTNPSIGRQLHIATCTVKGHVEQILAKLGVEGRTQAAVRGISLGLIKDAN
jgi:DNA-binding NarL/FixJ family response regulator